MSEEPAQQVSPGSEQIDPWAVVDESPSFMDQVGSNGESATMKDYGASVMKGGASMVKGIGWLAENLGAEDVGATLTDLGEEAVKYWDSSISPESKKEMSKKFITDDNGIGEGLTSPHTIGLALANSLLPMSLGIGAGGAVTKGIMAVAKPATAKGAAIAGATGYGAGEAAVSAPMAGSETYDEVMKMKHDDLIKHPAYTEVFNLMPSGLDEKEKQDGAKKIIAHAAGRKAASISGATTFVSGAPAGAMMGKLAKGLPLASTMPRAVATGAVSEGAQEAVQEGAEAVAQNYAIQSTADESRKLSDDVANRAVGGAVTGGVIGGALGGMAGTEVRSDNAGEETELSSDPWAVVGEDPASVDTNPAMEGISYEDAVNMADSGNEYGTNMAEVDQKAPKVPEPASTIEAQVDALNDGRKPAVLITPGESMPEIPEGLKTFELEDSGTLIYKDQQVLAKALNPETLGEALGYGTGAKPENPTGAVISMDAQGRIVAEQVTDETNPDIHQSIIVSAEKLAGEGGSVDLQPIEQVLEQRQAAVAVDMGDTAGIQVPTVEKGSEGASDASLAQDSKEIERAAQKQALAAISQGKSFEYNSEAQPASEKVSQPHSEFEVQPQNNGAVIISGPDVRNVLRQAGVGFAPRKNGTAYVSHKNADMAIESLSSEIEQTNPNDPTTPIESFGEKLKDSKRDKYQRMRDAVSDDEVANVPLSKSWPKADLDKIEDTYQAAFIKSIREEIPAKPRQSHKLKRWSEKVTMMRKFADDIQSGEVDIDAMKKMVSDNRVLREFETKVDLLSKLDRSLWGSVKTVSDWPNAYRYNEDGNKQASPSISVNRQRYHYNDSWTEVVDEIKADLGATAAQPAGRLKFEVRGNSATGFFINKKGDGEYRKLTDRFTDSKEAFEYIQNNHADLVNAWDGVKARDNVGKGDVRNKANRERTGKDYRKGKDISQDHFSEKFGFRGVDFGNYVKQGKGKNERQQSLNDAYDALMDLSEIMGVPTQALSLNGELGLAFGARGSGMASAHFEGADTQIKDSDFLINLTKTRGAGTLAHEFFHALDNYFQRQRGTAKGREGHYVTYEPTAMMMHNSGRTKLTKKALAEAQKKYPDSGFYKAENWDIDPAHTNEIRPEVEQAFEELVDALDASPMRSRARTIDKNKADGYWSRIIERAARSFENYVINEMALKGYENDYLANVKDWDSWSKNSERYPYLKPDEIAPIKEAFDNLFDTLETKQTEKGLALFSTSRDNGAKGGIVTVTQARDTITRILSTSGIAADINTVSTYSELPADVQADAEKQGSKGNVKGALHRSGSIYVVADQHSSLDDLEATVLHELMGHLGVRKLFGKDYVREMNKLYAALGGWAGVKKIADNRSVAREVDGYRKDLFGADRPDWQHDMRIAILTDELMAAIAQNKPKAMDKFKAVIGAIRQWLRDNGFAKLAEYGETDLLHVLQQGKKALINKTTATGETVLMVDYSHDQSDFEILPQENGTLIVKGDKDAIRAALQSAGRKAKGIPRKDGLLFGKSQAEGVRKALEARNRPNKKHEPTPTGMGGFDGFVDDHNTAVKSLSWDSVIGFAKDKRRILMGTLTNLQLGDVYSRVYDGMLNGNPLTNYNTLLQKLEAERNGALHEAELVDQTWDKLSNKEADAVGKLMNDATVYGIHPDKAFESQMPDLQKKLQQVRSEAEAVEVNREIVNENHRKLAYPNIAKRYKSLSEDAKGVYKNVRDLYSKQWNKTQEAMIDRISRNIPDEGLRKQSITEIRLAFRKAIQIGPYFPLARFGDYVTIARKDGDYIRDHHATSAQQKRAAAKYRKAGFQVSRVKGEEFSAGDIGNAPAFAQEVFGILDRHGLKQSDLADDVNQLMLKMMPDMSALKHSIHRKRIKGYSGDARRAFGHTVFHGAHHLSRIMYADQMQNEITRMKDEIGLLQSGKVSVLDDGNLAVDLLNEMKVRHEKIMNPNSHPMTSHLGSLGFIWYLGASPAAGIVNVSQTPLVTLPMLAGKYGWGKSSAALMRAMKDYARSPFKAGSYEAWVSLDRNKLLSKSEHALIDELIKDGTLDITQAHALAQLAETDTRHNAKGEMSRGRAKAMRYVGAFFHNAEVLNRQVSALAAYRLAKDSGSNHEQAVDQARKMVFDSHFNYASSNRPRYLKGDVVRVLTMFKQYSQHMTYALLRNFNQSFKGESKEVRNQARMTLAGILSQHALAAGTLGLPLASVIFSALDLAFDDDDEPYDSKAAYRNWLADTFGTKVGEAIAKGPVNAYTPIDLHSRVSLGELWLRTPDRDLTGKKEALYCQSAPKIDPPSASNFDPPKVCLNHALFLNLQLSFPVSIMSQ
ncbi:PLxRFG domain-containing protein [Mariprofundus micogutta]|nr:PLxRFG domain-containing protein [Mariprofundus micogutta]